MNRITITQFIRKVYDMLRRRALHGWAMLLAVLRKLRERGIWPWPKTVKAEEVCGEVERKMQDKLTREDKVYRKDDHKPEQNKSRKANRDTDREKDIPNPSTAYSRQIQDLTREARAHIEAHYDIRYNVLDGQAEIREAHDAAPLDGAFRTVTPQVLNTLVLRLHEEGIPVWDRDVLRLLNSLEPRQYHPITDYLSHLPQWDGTDRLTALARRVSADGLWIQVFGIWMRGMVRQWTRITKCGTLMDNDTNQLAPILISTEQGLHKSTFCRMLLPPELAMLYTDKFELGGRQNLEFPLCRHALISLDEFDRFSTAQMAKLKNLMQLGRLNVRRPHATHFEQMQRTASFIGTSNTAELLTDPTGSRRFFCQEVEHPIDCTTPLDHRQLYAQILHELSAGLPYFMDKGTEEAVQLHNRRYYRASALREAFLTLFGKATDDTPAEQTEWLTATDIYTRLQQRFNSHVINGSPVQLGQQLTFLHLEKRHGRKGNEYRVRVLG